ncbi:hypothetical protein ABID59_000148 [Bradyrhizobium sp. S3.3.6]
MNHFEKLSASTIRFCLGYALALMVGTQPWPDLSPEEEQRLVLRSQNFQFVYTAYNEEMVASVMLGLERATNVCQRTVEYRETRCTVAPAYICEPIISTTRECPANVVLIVTEYTDAKSLSVAQPRPGFACLGGGETY